MSQPVVLERDGALAVLRVNRPNARNALNWAAQEQFAAHVAAVAADPTVAALIVTGTGRQAFVAGGDIKEHVGHADAATGARLHRVMSGALHQLTQLPIPVLAAVNGDAYGGGCEIITACDLRLMRADAHLHFVQARVGLTTGWGGTARLVHLLGLSRALELLLTARALGADDAHAVGLVQRVVPADGDVLAEAVAWAQAITALPRDALAGLKRLAYAAPGLSAEAAAELEGRLFTALWHSANHREALQAFAQRRAPHFNRPDDPLP